MAITTVKTWSHGPEDTECGLTIGGIEITYAELAEIHDRESAIYFGVTPDLVDLWQNQGGHDFSQLVDWLYRYADQQQKEINNEKPATRDES